MFLCEKISERTFEGKTTKDAYLEACKWLSSNIIAMNNSEHVQYTFQKLGNGLAKKIKLTLYVVIDEAEQFEHICKVCEEANNLFYVNGNRYKCYSCKAKIYREQMAEKLKGFKNIMREKGV